MTLVVEVSHRAEFVELVRGYVSEMKLTPVLFWREIRREYGPDGPEAEILFLVPVYPPDIDWVIWRYRERVRAPPGSGEAELRSLVSSAVDSMLRDVGAERAVRITSMSVDGEDVCR